jgi:uncharacterized membrane protein YphA (DoxX/SURF4 family)
LSARPTSWRLPLPWLRAALGGIFVYYGWLKISDPYSYLKSVHEYGVLDGMNLVGMPLENIAAAGVPMLEIFGGLCLAFGLWRRGAAAWLGLFLAAFTVAVAWKATDPEIAAGQPSYLLREFDCGCGTGVVVVWEKLLMNLILIALLFPLGLRRPADPAPAPTA